MNLSPHSNCAKLLLIDVAQLTAHQSDMILANTRHLAFMLGQRRASSPGKHVLVSCWDSQDESVNQDAPHHLSFTQMSNMETLPQFSARANCAFRPYEKK